RLAGECAEIPRRVIVCGETQVGRGSVEPRIGGGRDNVPGVRHEHERARLLNARCGTRDEYHAADRERTERHANASRCARTAQELPHAIPPAGEEDAQHAERPEHETDPATEIRQPAGCYAEAY